jgi:hypothetical protein
VPPHEFLGCLGGRDFPQTRRAREQPELEVAPDHRRHGRELTSTLAQSLKAPDNELAHAVGDGQGRGVRDARSRLNGADGFHSDEGISLAYSPDLLSEVRKRVRVAADARKRPGEQYGVGPGERGERQCQSVRLAADLHQRATRRGGVGELLFPRGRKKQQAPSMSASRDIRQEPQAHVVGPMDVFEYQDQQLPGDKLLN